MGRQTHRSRRPGGNPGPQRLTRAAVGRGLKRWIAAAADTLCPDCCVVCSEILSRPLELPLTAAGGWCPRCAGSVVPLGVAFCLDCPPHRDRVGCRRSDHLRVRAAVQYGDSVAALVRATKYQRLPALTEVWLRVWRAVHGARPPAPGGERIIPVPLHPSRVRERGFDPVLEWGTRLSRHHGLPLARGLVRIRATPQQVGQSRRRRAANVSGAFAAGPEGALVRGRRLILADDVVTTGATAREAAAVLLSGGAAAVTVWCFAYEPLE